MCRFLPGRTLAKGALHPEPVNFLAEGEAGAAVFALPQQHAYGAPDGGTGPDPMPPDQLRAVLEDLADAG